VGEGKIEFKVSQLPTNSCRVVYKESTLSSYRMGEASESKEIELDQEDTIDREWTDLLV
jgi:hypothetical protein